MKFDCESKEVEEVLKDFVMYLAIKGAKFSQDIIFVEKNGDLSIHSSAPKDSREKLIQIPTELMPKVSDFDMEVKDEKFVIVGTKCESDVQKRCFKIMIKIYNLCDKLKEYREKSMWLSLKDNLEILDFLNFNKRGPKIREFYELLEQKRYDELLIEGFFKTRTFNLDNKKVLLPLIDYLNHDSRSPGFNIIKVSGKDVMSPVTSRPSDTDECFVSYNNSDSFGCLLNYGFFIDNNDPFNSVPFEMELNHEITFKVNTNLSQKGIKAKQFQDLRKYIPNFNYNDSIINVSNLLIPGKDAPQGLRHALLTVLLSFKPNLLREESDIIVKEIEQKLIEVNVNYYTKLKELCSSVQNSNYFIDMLKTMCECNLGKINEYKERCILGW